jgi:hypothetical protein
MRAFRESIHEFQRFASLFAERYGYFLNDLSRTLFPLISESDLIENAEVRHLLLIILNKEKTQLGVRTNFLEGAVRYLQTLEDRGIRDLDGFINEWNRVLDQIIAELEAQHRQSQDLLNALSCAEGAGLFQTNEEDKNDGLTPEQSNGSKSSTGT